MSLENNLDHKIFDEIEALVIDILLLPSTFFYNQNLKAFFTLLGLVKKAKEMATNLTNRSISHFFITIDNILLTHISSAHTACNISDSNFIIYIAINQYLSNRFYGIMIDINIFKYFTASYREFMTYIKDIKDTIINISKISAIYI